MSLVCTYVFSHRLSTPKIVLFLETERGQITILKKYTPDFSLPQYICQLNVLSLPDMAYTVVAFSGHCEEARQRSWRPDRRSGGQSEGQRGQPEGQRGQPKGLGGQPDSLGGELGSGPYGTELGSGPYGTTLRF